MKLLMTALMARFGMAIHATGWGTLIRSDDLSDGGTGTAIIHGNRCLIGGPSSSNPRFLHLVQPVKERIGFD
jgi:hypothetical protein